MFKKTVLMLILCFFAPILTGCSHSKITITRNTPASHYESMTANGKQAKGVVKKSSGVIIYKDISSTAEANGTIKINFGPKDVNFDLPFNMK